MIDLEDALARIVELAPEPPDVSVVTRRARQRRSRRRGTAISAVLIVVIGVGGAIAFRPTHDRKRVVIEHPTTESVRVTLLDGSHLEISGPPSLGLTKFVPSFSGALELPTTGYNPYVQFGHSFTVERRAPEESGVVVGRYETGDGHELVVHTTENGVVAIVQYEHWALVVGWNHDRTAWPQFAAALDAHESADGFLVIEPTAPWHLAPTDSPDMQLNRGEVGDRASFSFIGPSTFPSGCPKPAQTTMRTSQGWPVSLVNGASWCDAAAKVRVHVINASLVDDAIQGLRVEYTASSR